MDEWLEELLVFKKGKLLGLSVHHEPPDQENLQILCWQSCAKHEHIRTLDCQRDPCSDSALEVKPNASTCAACKGSCSYCYDEIPA